MSAATHALTLDGLGSDGPAKAKRRPRARKPQATWSVIAFGAAWCGPWPLLLDVLGDLAHAGVSVDVVDVDADAAAAERHRVVTLPTIVVLRDGQERRRVVGAVSAAELRSFVGLS